MATDHDCEASALDIQDRIAAMSDKAIRTAYLASDGIPGNPWTDALARAMRERGVDI